MAGRLNISGLLRHRARQRMWQSAGLLLMVAGFASGEALAQSHATGLADPTRPPAVMVEATVDPAKEDQQDVLPPAGLQTVLLRKGMKPLAIINDQSVELGGMVGEARLVKLTETEAVLQGPNGKEVLRLMPDAERKPVVLPVPSKPADLQAGAVKTGKRSKLNSNLTK